MKQKAFKNIKIVTGLLWDKTGSNKIKMCTRRFK